jgi:hypothetical protein
MPIAEAMIRMFISGPTLFLGSVLNGLWNFYQSPQLTL